MPKHFNLTKIKLLIYHLLTALTLVSQCWGTPMEDESKPIVNKQRNEVSILIVDDDEFYLKIFEEAFKDFNCVIRAQSGSQALDLMENQMFDVIITDYDMPIMNGGQLCKSIIGDRLRYNALTTMMFIHSAREISKLEECLFIAGVDIAEVEVLSKPRSS